MIAGSAGSAALAAVAASWLWSRRRQTGPRFDALMAEGDEAFRNGTALDTASVTEGGGSRMMQLYQKAVRIQPDSARAWGLLAYFSALRANEAPPAASAQLVAQSQTAIRRALSIDSKEPNAQVGLFLLQGPMLDWAARDRKLRSILANDPTISRQ